MKCDSTLESHLISTVAAAPFIIMTTKRIQVTMRIAMAMLKMAKTLLKIVLRLLAKLLMMIRIMVPIIKKLR